MERTNVAVKRKKPKKPKTKKPSQTQSQRQTVIVNLAEAKKVRRKKTKAKSKATAMPPSQQQQQLVQQQPITQPPFIYANQPQDRPLLPPDRPPVQAPVGNPLNPNVAVNPNQERPLIQLTPPAVVRPTAKPSLDEQARIDEADAQFLADRIQERDLREKSNRPPMARAVSAPERLIAEAVAVRTSPLSIAEQILTIDERLMADRQMPPMEAQRQLSPIEEEALARRGRGRPKGSKDKVPRRRSTSQELAEQRARASQPNRPSQPNSFTFGGSGFQEEPPLDRYYGVTSRDGRRTVSLVQTAEDQVRFAQSKKDRAEREDRYVALQFPPQSLDSAVSGELEYEPAPLGLSSDYEKPMSFM